MKPKTAAEIRQSYLDFFASKQHKVVPSAPVYLPSDKTLLFVNAGMVPFKEIFLGASEPVSTRVTDTQKCIRVSGKHNDLEEVGRDTYHHTFFEMLGNWSFGDYYKREAISWAWEYLTDVLGLDKSRLWASVYQDDDEAMDLWKELTDIDPEKILRFDEKDNFWEMGETGPCGPCSEIHYDGTPDGNCTGDMVNADLPEVIEIWNLVFIQYNRRQDGSLEELPNKHVDTGMGFERLVAVMQGKPSNYDTDVFMPFIEKLREMTGKAYEGENAVAMRVIADHLRTLSAAIADGVTPSNDGRGYVLRRLLRRAALYGKKLDLHEPFMAQLFPLVEASIGQVFTNIMERRDTILQQIHTEEEKFVKNLDRGTKIFAKMVDDLNAAGRKEISGDEAFDLYSTYGFPVDMTNLLAADASLTVDETGFEDRLKAEKDRNRSLRKKVGADVADLVADLVAEGVKSSFTGYDCTDASTKILKVVGDTVLLLAETPFYAESGGQLGDTGTITAGDATFTVTDTQRPAEGVILHVGSFTSGSLKDGDTVQATVDADRRQALERHHTATHIMNYALRDVVNEDIRQAGSMVAPDRLRFDFTWPEALTADQLETIEQQVNDCVMRNDPVVIDEIPFSEVHERNDIIAVFDEKYGDTVRVVDIGGYSKELCGGTHVSHAGSVGGFRIVGESSVSAGVRRLEAVCGPEAAQVTRKQNAILKQLSGRLSISAEDLPARLDQLLETTKTLERQLKEQSAKSALGAISDLVNQVQDINGIPVIAATLPGQGMDGLRAVMDELRNQIPSLFIVLGGDADGKAAFMASASKDLVEQGAHAGKVIGAVAKIAGGGGGGKPDRAQAGGKDSSKVAEAISKVPEIIAG